MSRWYEGICEESSNIIYSRIRLARNWDEYVFPSRLSEQAASQVTEQLREGLKEAETGEHPLLWNDLAAMNGAQKQALRERRILNRTAVEKNGPGGLYLSEDESCSLLLGADDHIRIQFLAPGLDLEDLWKKADQMDDFINERFSYAFDEKYGYLTTFPTNVGTGLKACVVLHLPMLSQVRKFQSIVGDMGRLGTAIRGLYGEGSENYGNMYELSNQRSLGQSEREIIEQVAKAATQLNNQELRVRNAALNARRLEREDETWKSYGILKYAGSCPGCHLHQNTPVLQISCVRSYRLPWIAVRRHIPVGPPAPDVPSLLHHRLFLYHSTADNMPARSPDSSNAQY